MWLESRMPGGKRLKPDCKGPSMKQECSLDGELLFMFISSAPSSHQILVQHIVMYYKTEVHTRN